MNKQLIRKILEESRQIPDEQLDFSCWYLRKGDKISKCPIGNHILLHEELINILKVKTNGIKPINGEYQTSFDVSVSELAKYLDISYEEADYIFCISRSREKFETLVEKFLDGNIVIRVCCADNCGMTYEARPGDKASVCDPCKDCLLEMCGL